MAKSSSTNVTVAEIAAACGVSPATVSRVLYNRSYVTEETRRKVKQEVQKRGYVFRHTSRLGKVLVITSAGDGIIHGEYYYELCNNLERIFESAGYEIMISRSPLFPHVGNVGFDAVVSLSYDSVFFDYWSNHLICPLIYVNRDLNVQADNCFHVDCDHHQAVQNAVKLLFKNGHRRIGLLLVGFNTPDNQQIWDEKNGFLRGVQQLGIGGSAFYEYTNDQEPHHALTMLLKHNITALIVPSITEGGRVASILLDLRWHIPRDISVIVGESFFYSQVNALALTTMKMPYEKMAQSCLDILQGECAHKNIMHSYELIERESVAQLRQTD